MRAPLLLVGLLPACGPGNPGSLPYDAGEASHLDGTVPLQDASKLTDGEAGTVDDGATEAGPTDPLAPCAVERDVFYAKWGPNPNPNEGSYGTGTATLTNLDTQWQTAWQVGSPFSIAASALNLQIVPLSGGPPVPGTFEVGLDAGQVDVSFFLMGDSCGTATGTLSIVDVQTTSAIPNFPELSSALLSFNLVDCDGPVQGCIRYSTSWDASTPLSTDAGVGDGGLLSPCQGGGDVFYANAEGGFGGIPDGQQIVTGAQGTWSGGLAEGIGYQLDVETDSSWKIEAVTSSIGNGIFDAGTFTSSGTNQGSFFSVEVAGEGCGAVPTGTFTVAALGPNGSSVLLGFDLQCNGAGTLRGCASYSR